jgi:hypothetical protein
VTPQCGEQVWKRSTDRRKGLLQARFLGTGYSYVWQATPFQFGFAEIEEHAPATLFREVSGSICHAT